MPQGQYEDAPSFTMFRSLKEVGALSFKATLAVLANERAYSDGGRTLPELAPSTLSREVYHRSPENGLDGFWRDFSSSCVTLTGRMVSGERKRNRGTEGEARACICEYYGGEGARQMACALERYHLDGQLYLNAVQSVSSAKLPREEDKCVLFVLLFVVAGCLGDPAQAVREAEGFSAGIGGSYGYTQTARTVAEKVFSPAAPAPVALAIQRIRRNADGSEAAGAIYPLAKDPGGTHVGKFASGRNAVNDVDDYTSRDHLRIWYQDGHWLAQDARSTNGTLLIKADSPGSPVTVKPRRGECKPGRVWPPVEICEGDRLILGRGTCFLVVRASV